VVDDKETQMTDLALRTSLRARFALNAAPRATVSGAHHLARRAGDRLRREQTGQDIVEYAGMLVLVAAVIAILFALNLPHVVGQAVSSAVTSIFSGNNHSSYTAPTVAQPPS
jgi:Flp pilus assembly pilin Flp